MVTILQRPEAPRLQDHELQVYLPHTQAGQTEKILGAKMKYTKSCCFILLLAGFGTLQARGDTGSFERTLQVSGPVRLEVTSGSGNITVRTGGSASVHILAKIQAHDSWFGMSAAEKIHNLESNPPIEQHGNTIRIGEIDTQSGI